MNSFDTSRINDFRYYASKALMIQSKEREWRRFDQWFEAQEIMHARWEKAAAKNLPIRFIVLKARQQGISTYTQGRIFHQAHTVPNTQALILSHDIDSAGKIFQMARGFYENLPPSIRPMKRYSSKKELRFENPDEKSRLENPGLRSAIEIQTAGKWTPSRGAMYHEVHFSEVAFWPDGAADEVVSAVLPMVPHLPGTIVIYESTANGMDNDFFDDWQAAVEGESEFTPIFIPWFMMQQYSLPFRRKRDREEFLVEVDEEEKYLRRKFKLKDEQLNWRRTKIREMRGDVDRFKQEFPSTAKEAFIFKGSPIFNRKKIEMYEEARDPRVCDISIDRLGLVDNPAGLLEIYEEPQEKCEYIVGVDVASGEGADYSCMEVLKRAWPSRLADQVAEWHGKVDPVALGKFAVILARYYNEGMLSIEINNHGFTTQAEAKNYYWNFYRWQYADRMGSNKATDKIGWQTNISTKPMMIDRAVSAVDQDLVVVRSAGLIDEMSRFVRLPGTMQFEAERGNDDRVMAWCIALVTLYMTQDGLDYDSMIVRAQAPVRVDHQFPRQGDPLLLGREALIDPADPRGYNYEKRATFANL